MSDTDIYKSREAMPGRNKSPKKRRRRSSSKPRAFDDKARKRRSKNSGARRLLHLFRKSENEKYVWVAAGIILLVTLVVVGIWQFFLQEHLIRKHEQTDEHAEVYDVDIPSTSDEPLMSTLTPEAAEENSASE